MSLIDVYLASGLQWEATLSPVTYEQECTDTEIAAHYVKYFPITHSRSFLKNYQRKIIKILYIHLNIAST